MTLRIIHYQRRPQDANFSIERVFRDIRQALPENVQPVIAICRFPSRGFFKRLYNAFEAYFRQGDVNHITGDVNYLAYFLRRSKTILTIHDLRTVHRLNGWKRRLFLWLWFRLPIRSVRLVTVISEATKNDLAKFVKIDSEHVRVIYDPVADHFQYVPKKFDMQRPRILFVGTGANKNFSRTIEALNGIPCHLRIIGRLSIKQTALLSRCRINYSNAYRLTSDEIANEYRLSDMLVFPSTFEGFGLPIIEAQATGRPVVTSNVLSMPEVSGGAACHVDPLDVSSIRNGIQKIIKNSEYREHLVMQGLENVKQFRAGEIARQYLALYHEIIHKNSFPKKCSVSTNE